MATVYLAIQQSFEREVALKVMAASLSEDKAFSDRFIHEAKVVSRLIHPHIVTVHDVGIHNGHHYLSMEYVPGRELKSCLDELSGDEVLRVMREMGSALDFAGQKGYVHRDVKPENIMLHEESGRAVLMDFGIAKADDVGSGLTQTGMALGTPYYMSPEQARGKKVDGRADLYSLGVVFYKMLMGTVPFEGDSAVAIGIKHISEPIPELPIRLAVFQPILNKLLAKDREQRYQRGAELIKGLESLTGEVIDKSRKQYFKKTAGKKPRSRSLSSENDETVISAYANSALTASQQSAEPRSKLWLLPLLLCGGLAGAYYHFFGPQFPPSQQDQQAVLMQLGLVEKPRLTLEQLLQTEPQPIVEAAPQPGLQNIQPFEEIAEQGVFDDTIATPVAGALADGEPLGPQFEQNIEQQSERQSEQPQVAALSVADQLKQQIDVLALAYQQDPNERGALVVAYQQLLVEEPGNTSASRGLKSIESELLEDMAVALDEQPSNPDEIMALTVLSKEALGYFPELESNKRFQRLSNKLATQQTIQKQLETANELLDQGQLTTPVSDNAKAYYEAVLALEPDNAIAKSGLVKIADAYYKMASSAHSGGRHEAALQQIAKGLSVAASHGDLNQLKNTIQAEQANQHKIAQLLAEAKQLAERGAIFTGQPNAMQQTQKILHIDRGNIDASGLQSQWLSQLIARLEKAIDSRAFDVATLQLSPALVMLPSNKQLLAAQAQIEAMQPVIEVLRLSGVLISDLTQALPSQFQAGRVLHVGFSYKNFADATTVLQATLYDGEQTVQIAAVPVIVSGQQGNNFFKINRAVEGFKAGGYRLEILLDNKQILSQSFVVIP